ncbi:hypothetical protein GGR98_001431 [Parageobacillus caldoxylosilyticus]|nr:hypothetical protein [Parageobacillus caldoxylosilyticus]
MSSLLESIEKEVKHRVYETMIDCLESYQGQVKEAIEEFHQGTRAFYRAMRRMFRISRESRGKRMNWYTGTFAANRGTYLCNCR